MAEYEGSEVVRRRPADVFEFVSHVDNLPRFLPTTRVAEPSGPDKVHVAGTALGHAYDAEGLFRARPEQLRVEWGSVGVDRYAGWMQVADSGRQFSEVTLHLSFLGDAEKEYESKDAERVAAGAIADTLRHLKAEVEELVPEPEPEPDEATEGATEGEVVGSSPAAAATEAEVVAGSPAAAETESGALGASAPAGTEGEVDATESEALSGGTQQS